MKSPTMYIVFGVAVVLVSLAVLSMFGAKQPTPTTPVATSSMATSTTASTTANDMQVYRNEKFGLQFSWTKTDILSDEEKGEKNWQGIEEQDVLVVHAMNPDLQRPINLLNAVSASRWEEIKKSTQQLVDDPQIKATKKVFEKSYGTVTEIKGQYNAPADPFCSWYIENPTKTI